MIIIRTNEDDTMRIKTLSVVIALCSLLSAPIQSNAQVDFAGWVTPSDNGVDIPPAKIPNHYEPYSLKKIAKNFPHREKVIIIDPRTHTWRAYSATGKLMRSGLATAGSRWCPDIGRPCRTRTGTFHIYTLGSSDCKSTKYPVGRGGAPMPYCMFFNGGQGLHGSNQVVAANVSHGCVRLHVGDARWIRYNFATIGTKVIIKSY